MVNSELLNKIADQIEAHPESFNMGTWAQKDADCGTQYCIAGWAIVKGTPKLHHYWGGSMESWLAKHVPPGETFKTYGAELLGIDLKTADILFFNWDYTVDFPILLRELGKGKSIRDFIKEEDNEEE